MEINFCRRCGQSLNSLQGQSGAYKCANGHIVYYKSYPAALGVIVNQKNELLVAVRGQEPGLGTLDFPGGFLDVRESFAEAFARELQEETGLEPKDYTAPLYLCDAVDDYDYQGELLSNITIVYWVRLLGDASTIAADDVADLRWMALEDIDETKVHPGFRGVRRALELMPQRLLEK